MKSADRLLVVFGGVMLLCMCCVGAFVILGLSGSSDLAASSQGEPTGPLDTGDAGSAPTLTPLPIAATEPAAAPEFVELYRWTGEGVTTTDPFRLEAGIVRVKWNFSGDSNSALAFRRLDDDSFVELLVNEIGAVAGQAVLEVEASDLYVLEITGRGGTWIVTVEYRPM